MNRRRRRGFVLVMTLVVIAISGLLLVGLASHSLNLVADALVSQEELQLKWGIASCQRFAFSRSDTLLSKDEATGAGEPNSAVPKRNVTASIDLGGQVFTVQLADESAKLDVNNVWSGFGAEKSPAIVRKLAGGRWQVALRPLKLEDQRDAKEGYFECWDQVFDRGGEFDFGDYLQATNELTCWSSGLCLRTATDSALAETAKIAVGSIGARRLVELRRDDPTGSVDSLLPQIGVTENRMDRLRKLLSDVSTSHSVLVSVAGPGRQQTSFVVRETIGPGVTRYSGFSW